MNIVSIELIYVVNKNIATLEWNYIHVFLSYKFLKPVA